MKSPKQDAMYVTSRNLRNKTTRYTNETDSIPSPIIPLDGFLGDVLPHVFENRMNGLRRTSNATAFQKFEGERSALGQRVAWMSRHVMWLAILNAD